MKTNVAVFHSDAAARYPDAPPYHPAVLHPELAAVGHQRTSLANPVHEAVRQTLLLLGLDADRFGSASWNPLGAYVRPGDTVVIKPNLVLHEFGDWLGTSCLTTHGSVLRAVIDYAHLAAGPSGKVVVADAPLQGADFERMTRQNGLVEIQQYYRQELGVAIDLVDLRQVRAMVDESSSFIKEQKRLPGDPRGYELIDLKRDSRLESLDGPHTRYLVGDYDQNETNVRHGPNHHQYVVSNTILQADAVISVPKLKTHSKVGLTVCLKNMIGIIGSKDCLPHHRLGRVARGGDEFSDHYPLRWLLTMRANQRLQGRVPVGTWRFLRSAAQRLLGAGTPIQLKPGSHRKSANGKKRFYPAGSWHGNDTIWRTVDDLNRILFFHGKTDPTLGDPPRRRFFTLVDGIVGMEGNGPLRGSPKPCGLILAGEDPLAVDVTAATLQGFDWRQIRMLAGIAEDAGAPRYASFSGDENDVTIASNEPGWRSLAQLRQHHFGFAPPAGWYGHVESR